MNVSHLTHGRDALIATTTEQFVASGYARSPLTEGPHAYYVRVLNGLTGGSHTTLNTGRSRTLALITSHQTGGTVSELTTPETQMWADLVNAGETPPQSAPAWLEPFRAPSGDLPRAGFALVAGEVKCWDGTTDAIAITDLIPGATVDADGLVLEVAQPALIPAAGFTDQLLFPATYLIEGAYSVAGGAELQQLNVEGGTGSTKYTSIYQSYVSITSDDYNTFYLEASAAGTLSGRTATTISATKVAISQDGGAFVSDTGSVDYVGSEVMATLLFSDPTYVIFTGRCTILFVYDEQPDADLVTLSGAAP